MAVVEKIGEGYSSDWLVKDEPIILLAGLVVHESLRLVMEYWQWEFIPVW